MSISISVCIATCGSDEWRDLALSWALPSVENQQADEVVVVHLESGGVAEARNQAARQATGTHLLFLDGDDQLCDGYVDAIRLAHVKATAPGGSWVKTNSGDRPTVHGELTIPALYVPSLGLCDPDGVCLTPPSIPDWDRWPEVNCAVIGTVVPRALFLRVGGFPDDPLYEDWACWLACVSAGARLVPVPDAVYCATRNPNGRNLQPLAVRQETYETIRGRYDMAAIPRNEPLS